MSKDKITNPHRAELAVAIAAAESAKQSLVTARKAANTAETRRWAAQGRLEELQKLTAGSPSPDDQTMEALAAAGSDFDILAHQMPDAEARAGEEKAEKEIAAWRAAQKNAEKIIPDRQEEVEQAARNVAKAARAVIAKSFDVGALLSEAEAAAASVVEKRTRLMYIRPFLDDEADSQAISSFLSRSWLIHEGSEAWKGHPLIVAHRAAHEALLQDAEAPLPA
jgi:hypothetical protein